MYQIKEKMSQMLSQLEKKLISDNIQLNELYTIEWIQIQKPIIYLQQQKDFLKKESYRDPKQEERFEVKVFAEYCEVIKKTSEGKGNLLTKMLRQLKLFSAISTFITKLLFLFISLAEVFAACILNCHFSRMDCSNRVHIQVRMYYHNLRRNFLLCPPL